MDDGGDHYGGVDGGSIFGGTIDGSVRGLGRNSTGSVKADEAYLLSQATTTAMIAARSILMAGGTEETALKTAKAAAQSVLNPGVVADADSGISGRSNNFLRRRKAKRQAEVVASMALISATANIQSMANGDWETMSVSSASQTPYSPRNMIPPHQNMNGFNQNDDPSVILGSFKNQHAGYTHERERSHLSNMLPPQSPRHTGYTHERERSHLSNMLPPQSPRHMGNTHESERSHLSNKRPPQSPRPKRVQKEQQSCTASRPPNPSSRQPSFSRPHSSSRPTSFSNRAPPSHDSAALARKSSERMELSKRIEQIQSRRKSLQANFQKDDSFMNLSHDSSQDQESVVVRSLDADSSSSYEGEPEQADDESLDSTGTEDESVLQPRSSKTAGMEKDYVKTIVDPVLFSFTNAFNAFSCGPTDMDGFMCEDDQEKKGATRKAGCEQALKFVEHRDDDEVADFTSGDEAADFQDTKQEDEEDVREVLDSRDHSGVPSDFFSSSCGTSRSHSSTSADSEQILSELNMSTSEDGEIQVRSTIRETMEQIVSKSQKNGSKYNANNTEVDRTWLTYELRQDNEPLEMTSTVHVHKLPAPTVQTPTKKMDEERRRRGWFRTKREATAAKAAKKTKKREKQATPLY
jgi:hypothetical protein